VRSSTERTHQITLCVVVGALNGEVLLQFLIEGIMQSALGGVIGAKSWTPIKAAG